MHTLILHLGSNVGHRWQNLQQAIAAIAGRIGAVAQRSRVYETAAWGNTEQAAFLNLALLVHTTRPPEEVLHEALAIEKELGRERHEKWAPRVIDIDLIFYDDLVLERPTLILPHPLMAQRRFVLAPLADICPDLVHPVHQQSVAQLLDICPDDSAVSLVPEKKLLNLS